jgi:uncharacterized protein (TIGR02611 family)
MNQPSTAGARSPARPETEPTAGHARPDPDRELADQETLPTSRSRRRRRRAWRVSITLVGLAVLALGIVAIPYPGPGWLIVFAGLAVLATEFVWARDLLHYARGRYDTWTGWLARQPTAVRLGVLTATALIVLVALWLVGGLALAAGVLGLEQPAWLQSPLLG